MRKIIATLLLLLVIIAPLQALAQEIQVSIDIRGNTGLEIRLKNIMEREFERIENVSVTDDKSICHLFIGLTMVEQAPIRFYGLGVSIAYHIRGEFYSRPSTDVSQFGAERMEEVCVYLVREIDKVFLEPLKNPV